MESVLEYFDPDVELIAPPQWLEDRVLRGHTGLRKNQAGWDEHFDDLRTEVENIIDVGENGVIALYTQYIRMRGSDRELAQPGGLRAEFRRGKIMRWNAYLSWGETLEAVGLEGNTRQLSPSPSPAARARDG
jgi:hypothetical protein